MSVSSIKAQIREVNEKIKEYKNLKNDLEILKCRTDNMMSSGLVSVENVFKQMLKENEDTSEGNFLIDLEIQGETYSGELGKLNGELESAKSSLSGTAGAAQGMIGKYEAEKSRLEEELREAEEKERQERLNAIKSFIGIG